MVWAAQSAIAAPETDPAYDFTGDGLVTWLDAAACENAGQSWWGSMAWSFRSMR
jgi:hypothetical protein